MCCKALCVYSDPRVERFLAERRPRPLYDGRERACPSAPTSADGDDAVINLGGGNSVRLVGYLAGHTIADLEDDIVIF